MAQLIRKSPLLGLTKRRKALVMILFFIFIFFGIVSIFVKDLIFGGFVLLMGCIVGFTSVYKNPLAKSNKITDILLLASIFFIAIVLIIAIFLRFF